MSPIELGEAIIAARREGRDLRLIESAWMDVLFVFDCGGLIPADVEDDDSEQFSRYFLYSCGLSEAEVVDVWAWYESLSRQGTSCCAAHPGKFVCGKVDDR